MGISSAEQKAAWWWQLSKWQHCISLGQMWQFQFKAEVRGAVSSFGGIKNGALQFLCSITWIQRSTWAMVNEDKSSVRNRLLWHRRERCMRWFAKVRISTEVTASAPQLLWWQKSRSAERDRISLKWWAQKEATSSQQLAESFALFNSHKTKALPEPALSWQRRAELCGAVFTGLGATFRRKLELLAGTLLSCLCHL